MEFFEDFFKQQDTDLAALQAEHASILSSNYLEINLHEFECED